MLPVFTALAGVCIIIIGFWLWGTESSPSATVTIAPTAPLLVTDKAETSAADTLPPPLVESSTSADSVAGHMSEALDWGKVVPLTIGQVAVQASVADTFVARMVGLSNTPYLPSDMVKLFVFDSDGPQPIWMKDMQYPIDIMWVDRAGVIVHLELSVDPSTYPQRFTSPVPARYVLEANAGFATAHQITIGTSVDLP